MAEFIDMETALISRLNTITGNPDIAWPNIEFRPSGEYLRPAFLPSDTIPAALGASGLDETNGVYQVDCFTERGAGRSTLVDTVADHFKRGTVITYGSVNMRVRSVSIGASRDEGAYYVTPITVNWQTYTEPR